MKYASPRGSGVSPISGPITSNTERTQSSSGSVSIGSSTTRGSSSTSSPSRSRSAASTESPSIPGTVRTSIPAVA